MSATVTSKGQVPLPKKIRDALGIESGLPHPATPPDTVGFLYEVAVLPAPEAG